MAVPVTEPTFTQTHIRPEDLVVPDGAAIIFGKSPEERSQAVSTRATRLGACPELEVLEEDSTAIKVRVAGVERIVELRSNNQTAELIRAVASPEIFLDITGLPHHVWAPLLRSALDQGRLVKAVYVEPEDYSRFVSPPTEGQIYDLSERISGLAPLPGFASIAAAEPDSIFIPLLGFEGTRLKYMVEQIQPIADNIFPIVGIPGFRTEYPFESVWGNKVVLAESHAWHNMEYAPAHCPFSIFELLKQFSSFAASVTVAPIGTKPHALGAMLFKLANSAITEIAYDHPIRSKKRSVGAGRTFLYHISLSLSG
jgi:hypothetical protein